MTRRTVRDHCGRCYRAKRFCRACRTTHCGCPWSVQGCGRRTDVEANHVGVSALPVARPWMAYVDGLMLRTTRGVGRRFTTRRAAQRAADVALAERATKD